ncbi:hypothetical protein EHE19_007005 [Ruminiclostridium herbifermentans]|uniref:Copper amine oxidase-like N-terminal domain-containing protein n=1 Tax=Ruminiclostridium herbifermentans TaxID=2488810 RepID=A0A4V6EP95_9FIRM|nr:hypothetical protein [Ruminiclostridium herbifermentans]QNU68166.1 hypothetical protein EHE19_007005 [Ruminiclostridium herbifermentans]
MPGFIEGRDITVDGGTVYAIVVEKPEPNSRGTYDFFEIVTTDPKAVTITSSVLTSTFNQMGDFEAELEDGRVTYNPYLYEYFEILGREPLYLGFSFLDKNSEVIYDFPLWVIFEGEFEDVPDFLDEFKDDLLDEYEYVDVNELENKESSSSTSESTLLPIEVREVIAKPATPTVIINGKQIAFYSYNIDGYNYFKLRDLAKAFSGSKKEFEVYWDSVKKTIDLLPGKTYTSDGKELVPPTTKGDAKGVTNRSRMYLDGEEIYLEAYNINGNNYFKLKDLANALDFSLVWDGVKKQIIINTNTSYTEQ